MIDSGRQPIADRRARWFLDRRGRSRSNKALGTRGTVASDEGKTVDELTAKALKRDLARRATQRTRREAEERRERMAGAQIEGTVNQAVQDWRRERRR